MTVNQMRFIDKYVGLFACIVFTFLDKYFLKIFRIFKRPPIYRSDKILFIKFWGMGSILLASPVVRAVRKKYPKAKIFFLTFSQNRQICESLGLIDEIIVIDPSSFWRFIFSTIKAARYLRGLRLDLAIDLEFLTRFSSVMTYLVGTRRNAEFHSNLLWRGDFARVRVNFNYYFHVTENFLNLVNFLDIKDESKDLAGPILSASVKDRVNGILRDKGINNIDTLIGININSSDMALERRWPKENFVFLVKKLLDNYDVKILLIGAKEDRTYVDTFLNLINHRKEVINLAAETSIKELIAILKHCSLFISSDSGPLHIAEALGIPTVSFFGPETPVLFGPRGDTHLVYYKNLLCSPCMNIHNNKLVNCTMENMCMTTINADEVYRAIQKKYRDILDNHKL